MWVGCCWRWFVLLTSGQASGLELGLQGADSIVDRTIRLHGGTVHAANAPGGGLVVELILPALG